MSYLTGADYDAITGDFDGYKIVTLRISYQELIDNNLLKVDPMSSSRKILVNLNPRIKYHNQYEMWLDYIEIEDRMHHELQSDVPSYSTGIGNRLPKVIPPASSDVVTNIYTADEPFQSHFDSFNQIQSILMAQGVTPLTAVYDYQFKKFNMNNTNTYYDHIDAFKKEARPQIIMPDIYPIRPDNCYDWNSGNYTDEEFLQRILDDRLVAGYLSAKHREASEPDRPFYPVVQAFGHWNRNTWESWILPPPAMLKMLQYMPLCFDPDGIFNYRFCGYQRTNGTEIVGDYAACNTQVSVSDFNNSPALEYYGPPSINNSVFDPIQEANQKIRTYMPLIKSPGVAWMGSNTIAESNAYPYFDLSTMLLTNVSVGYSSGSYRGYIQSGYYLDEFGCPYIMIVNRRANYFSSTNLSINAPHKVPVHLYNQHFPEFSSQTVSFTPNTVSHNVFGTHIAMYDPYDSTAVVENSGVIEVEIGPGDGKLLQMCSSLPPNVTSNADVKSIAYLSGNITIDNSSEVTIHPGTTTNIFANSTIRVKGGSTLNISGTVNIAQNVSIIVEEGSSISFNNAICNWGANSILQVEGSEISATNTILENLNPGERWKGLRISDAGSVSLTTTTISGAEKNVVQDSNLTLFDCKINIPEGSFGLHISHSSPNWSTIISSSTDEKGFYSTGSSNTGLLHDPYGYLKLNGVTFEGLSIGLWKLSESTIQDTIRYCTFNNNTTGMYLIGSLYSPNIQNCGFYDNELGAYLEVAAPRIQDCAFHNCDIGIRMELSVLTSGGIYDTTFLGEGIGIESRGSNLRVAGNEFYTNTGILNHAGSILNMGNSALNYFKAESDNLRFEDTSSYNAQVQLYQGHNDFYQDNPGPQNPSWDFHFDANWYVSTPRSNAINANFNWFEDNHAKVHCQGHPSDYVLSTILDTSPNVNMQGIDRMSVALSAELVGNHQIANITYKAILDEKLETEEDIQFDALDAYYRTAELAGETLSGRESYLLAKIAQYDEDAPILTKYLQNYLVKNCLDAEAYQAAIDLIQVRIDNAESPVDSLHAVMDLEIVLQLAAMSTNKKPISTKYTQYIYPDRYIFKAKHAEHWELLDELLNGTQADLSPIPKKALISANYPNPFNPSTTVAFSVPEYGSVKLSIYNLRGQKVKELINTEMQKGFHKAVWDGTDAKHNCVSSGLYLLRLETAKGVSTRKVMLLK